MIRSAAPEDTKIIGQLIRALANYEKLSHVVQLDENRLREHLFGPRPYAEVLLAEEDEWRKPLPPLQSGYDWRTSVGGFEPCFQNYSPFLSTSDSYLEYLFARLQSTRH